MAPQPPLGRARVIERIERGELPFRFGSPHPLVIALEQEGRFRLRGLVVSPGEVMAAAQSARVRGESFLPEDLHELARPTGAIYADASSREELADQLRAMTWPERW